MTLLDWEPIELIEVLQTSDFTGHYYTSQNAVIRLPNEGYSITSLTVRYLMVAKIKLSTDSFNYKFNDNH